MSFAVFFMIGYGLGSIPFGLLLVWVAGGSDLRQIGSGNIGATNVLRSGSKVLAAATLLLDAAKGFSAVWLADCIAPELSYSSDKAMMIAGAGAFIGHCYPVWLRFRGGKGVATMLGVSWAFGWLLGLTFALSWLVTVVVFRISSLGAMVASIATPIAAFFLSYRSWVMLLSALALLLLWRHRDNMRRLIAGSEPRIGAKTSDSQ